MYALWEMVEISKFIGLSKLILKFKPLVSDSPLKNPNAFDNNLPKKFKAILCNIHLHRVYIFSFVLIVASNVYRYFSSSPAAEQRPEAGPTEGYGDQAEEVVHPLIYQPEQEETHIFPTYSRLEIMVKLYFVEVLETFLMQMILDNDLANLGIQSSLNEDVLMTTLLKGQMDMIGNPHQTELINITDHQIEAADHSAMDREYYTAKLLVFKYL